MRLNGMSSVHNGVASHFLSGSTSLKETEFSPSYSFRAAP